MDGLIQQRWQRHDDDDNNVKNNDNNNHHQQQQQQQQYKLINITILQRIITIIALLYTTPKTIL